MIIDSSRLQALSDVAEALAGELVLEDVLTSIVEVARRLTGAQYAALGVIGEDQRLVQFVHTGMDPETVRAIGPEPTGKGVLGLLIRDPHPLRLEHLSHHAASSGFPESHPPMDTFLGVPVLSNGQVFGNLYLTEKPGGFDEVDEVFVGLLAAQAGTAIENAQLADQLRDLAVQHERDRISRELHDGIIQSLFSIGMNLESATAMITTAPDRARERISGAVDRIDDAIRELRNTIFHLRPHAAAAMGLRSGLVELAREHEINAIVRPSLHVPHDLDARAPAHVVPDVLQVVREALSNVGRHARASRVTLRADVEGGTLTVEVLDDGEGFSPAAPAVGRGLENIQERAAVLDGVCTIDSTPGGGTRLVLTVPIEPEPGGS